MHSSAMQSMSEGAGHTRQFAATNLHPANVMATMTTHAGNAKTFAGENVGGHAATIEMLHHAVCSMKPEHVRHMLHGGVNVNEPIDKEGHTILDAFAVERMSMLKQLINLKASPEEKTNIVYANQENAREIMHLLMEHGAMVSSPETQRNRVSYVA